MTSIGYRIKEEREKLEFTQEYFGALGGVARNAQVNYEKDKRRPDADYLEALAHSGAGIDVMYILTRIRMAEVPSQRNVMTAQVVADHYDLVPRMSITAGAGRGRLVTSEQVVDHFAFRKEWLAQRGLDVKRCALIEVTGDSMETKLASGDLVLIDLRETDIKSGSAYVVRIGEDLMVKYLERLPGDKVQVSSENRVYPAYIIDLEQADGELVVIGKVAHSMKDWR